MHVSSKTSTTLLRKKGQYGSEGFVLRAGLVASSFDQNWVTVLISFEEDDDGLVVSKTEYKSLKTCTYLF